MFIYCLPACRSRFLRAGIVFLLVLLGGLVLPAHRPAHPHGCGGRFAGPANPYAPCDIGFQLSFCAVLGVQASVALTRWGRSAYPRPGCRGLAGPTAPCRADCAFHCADGGAGIAGDPAGAGRPGPDNQRRGCPCQLLTVWMLQPALVLGLVVLALQIVAIPLAIAARWPIWLVFLLAVWLRFLRAGLLVRCSAVGPAVPSRGSTRCWCWSCWAYWRWYIMRRPGSAGSSGGYARQRPLCWV